MKLIELVQAEFTRELRDFLVEAKKNTWAAGKFNGNRAEYNKGQWGFTDKWIGEEALAGQQIATYRGVPIWTMF